MDGKLDSVGVWLAVATVLEAVAAILVGLLEDSQRLWALLPGGLGIVALFWALSLFNAHKLSSSSARAPGGPSAPPGSSSRSAESLETERERRYQTNRGLFLVHTWRRSDQEGQAVDVKVQLAQHGPGPLKVGAVKSVTYTFGPMFPEHTRTIVGPAEGFAINDSLYAPLLVLAEVAFTDGSPPLLLDRYINFDEGAGSQMDPDLAESVAWDEEHFGLIVYAMHLGRPTLEHLDDLPGPFIDFVFEVVNGSLLTIKIDTEIEGQIVCSGTDLQRRPRLHFTNDWATEGMKHGWRTQIELRQWLTPEEVTWITSMRDSGQQSEIWFSFHAINLTVRADDKKKRLDLNRGQSVYIMIT